MHSWPAWPVMYGNLLGVLFRRIYEDERRSVFGFAFGNHPDRVTPITFSTSNNHPIRDGITRNSPNIVELQARDVDGLIRAFARELISLNASGSEPDVLEIPVRSPHGELETVPVIWHRLQSHENSDPTGHCRSL